MRRIETADILICEFSKRLTDRFTSLDTGIICLLANLADCDKHRRILIEKNIINKVVLVIMKSDAEGKNNILRVTTKLIHNLSNLCIFGGMPDYQLFKPLIPHLKLLLSITIDNEIITNVLRCFVRFFQEEEYSMNIYNSPTLNAFLKIGNNLHISLSTRDAVLEIIGCIIEGEEFNEDEEIVEPKLIPFICTQFLHRESSSRNLVCRILSNLVISDDMRKLLQKRSTFRSIYSKTPP